MSEILEDFVNNVYEEVPNWRETFGGDRPEYILVNGRAMNVYGALRELHMLQEEVQKLLRLQALQELNDLDQELGLYE